MTEWTALAAAAIGAALFALVRGIALALDPGHRASRARLASIERDAIGDASRLPASTEAETMHSRRRTRSARSTFAGTRRWLRRAGLAWEPTDLAGVTLATFMVPLALVVMITSGNFMAAAAVGGACALLPPIVVQRRAAKRATQLNSQVVETLEVVASSLRSGFGFTQAMDLAAREQTDPIRSELLQAMHEISLGAATDEALERLVERTGDADLALAVNAVIIQRRVGGDLTEVLSNITTMIRERIRIRGEIQTLTAQARMSAWIVGLLPVALAGALTLLQPDQMRVLVNDPVGRLLVGIAVVLQLIGFMAVRRIAAIEY